MNRLIGTARLGVKKIRKNGCLRSGLIVSDYVITRIRGEIFRRIFRCGTGSKGLRVGKGVKVRLRKINIGHGVSIGDNCTLGGRGQVDIGNNVVINHSTHIDCDLSMEIGECTLIGPCCYIVDSSHVPSPTGQRLVSEKVYQEKVKIGSNVWIGQGVSILMGVVIEDNAVVGSSSLVTRDVKSGSVVVGVPARPIKRVDS